MGKTYPNSPKKLNSFAIFSLNTCGVAVQNYSHNFDIVIGLREIPFPTPGCFYSFFYYLFSTKSQLIKTYNNF